MLTIISVLSHLSVYCLIQVFGYFVSVRENATPMADDPSTSDHYGSDVRLA